MVVIIAETRNFASDYLNVVKLKDGCLQAGAEQVFIVQTTNELKDAVRENKYKKILLFSNFPPNSSYPGSGKKMKQVDKGDYIERSWEADSYSQSMGFFKRLFAKQKFINIHFITGAPKQMLGDEQLKSLSPETRITVLRKTDYISAKVDYNKLLQNYIVEKTKDVAGRNPFI